MRRVFSHLPPSIAPFVPSAVDPETASHVCCSQRGSVTSTTLAKAGAAEDRGPVEHSLAMKLAPALLALALGLGSATARADAYTWGGSSGRFDVEVTVLGFNEGMGEGGWDEGSAREFAAWARRFNAIIPRGSSVSVRRDTLDDATKLTIRRGHEATEIRIPGGVDLDLALKIAARSFGVRRAPKLRAPARLFTIQLFASRTEAGAARFSGDMNELGVEADASFYHEACLPCSIPTTRTLGPGPDRRYRVITGVFDSPRAARRSLVALRRAWKVGGFVREL